MTEKAKIGDGHSRRYSRRRETEFRGNRRRSQVQLGNEGKVRLAYLSLHNRVTADLLSCDGIPPCSLPSEAHMPEAIEHFRERIRRRAIVMQIGGFRPTDDPKASWFGKVTFGLPNEQWPETVNNRPMAPLTQINMTELPFRPHRLDDLEFLTVFIDPQNPGRWDEKEMWCLRAYPALSRLVPLTSPGAADFHIKAFQMRPTVIERDYPVYDDIADEIPEGLDDSYIDDFDNTSGFKLGGWPTLIQSEIFWAPFNKHPAKPEFVFQIDSTERVIGVGGIEASAISDEELLRGIKTSGL